MSKLRCVKGMHDILPEDMPKWHYLENCYRNLVSDYGYEEIRTPILESLDLFVRGIGESTDIVEKEMYAFEDKGNAKLALRPEGTASVIRAFLQNNLEALTPVSKLYYIGPMFRRERPARGRYRQFYQAGAELIGIEDATADAELIGMAVTFVKTLGIQNVNVQINSLGDPETRPAYRNALVQFFSKKKEQLCNDCVRRLDTNPLRILDCKVEACSIAAQEAPNVFDYLSDDAHSHFSDLQQLLSLHDVNFTVVPTMVRGLDYYTRTIFEIQGGADILGAQSTIVGGGRYNGLVKQLGGRNTPTIGFAFGIERLLLLLGDNAKESVKPTVFVAGVGEGGLERTIRVSRQLRNCNFKVEAPYKNGSLRSQLKRADKSSAVVAVIAGADEALQNAVTIRNMQNGEQQIVPLDELEPKIRELM
ncbi:MAG: histidine--tRNA ligase [Deltaproteobacteria bacterium]|nr:histidine--tRNA ligase [Deltaproteobacteria bacterium]